MADVGQLLVAFVNPMMLIMALVMVLSMIVRSGQRFVHNDLLFGAIFAAALFHSMSDPIPLPTGGIMDMRGLLIGAAAGLLGPKVGVFTLGTGLGLRWYIGGPGMVPGLVSMFLAYGGGLIWRYVIKPRGWKFWKETVALALCVSCQNLAVFLTEPQVWATLFMTLGIYTTTCNLIGTFVLKFMFEGEMSYLSQKKGLERAAATDHLTGLQNRRSLEMAFPSIQHSSLSGEGLTTLYFDIDHFKKINDTYGHSVGDEVLREITERLSTVLRSRDVFSRLGGDEFVLMLPNLGRDDAHRVAERCRRMVAEKPILAMGEQIDATISIGAIWTRKTTSFDGLLAIADEALYEAKARGRNTVAFRARGNSKPEVAQTAAA